jgi:hypothetical protein
MGACAVLRDQSLGVSHVEIISLRGRLSKSRSRRWISERPWRLMLFRDRVDGILGCTIGSGYVVSCDRSLKWRFSRRFLDGEMAGGVGGGGLCFCGGGGILGGLLKARKAPARGVRAGGWPGRRGRPGYDSDCMVARQGAVAWRVFLLDRAGRAFVDQGRWTMNRVRISSSWAYCFAKRFDT